MSGRVCENPNFQEFKTNPTFPKIYVRQYTPSWSKLLALSDQPLCLAYFNLLDVIDPKSEPKKTQLRRDEAIEEEKVFKGGCPPLSKFDFDFI
uniref:Uncharacterized protein n=1 Tax=Helianthus annuus TaxID=4232 RepID=A0A251V4P1_HELAN